MFTGLVEALGEVVALDPLPEGAGLRLVIRAPALAREATVGDSIAVNGCCLTVTRKAEDTVAFDAVPETLARTTLGQLTVGASVNLERPLRLEDRLGGHLVLGHVDAVGRVAAVQPEGNSLRMAIAVPEHVRRYLVPKGSIAVDGVSLTVASLTADGCEVAIIPHTAAVTTLGRIQPGDRVNLEADIIGKYVERLLGPYAGLPAGHGPHEELRDDGHAGATAAV